MLKKYFIPVLIIAALPWQSCVSSKKYKEATSSLAFVRKQNRELNEHIDNLKERLSLMESAHNNVASELDAKNMSLQSKEEALSESMRKLTEQQEKLRNLQAMIEQQKEQSEALRRKMVDALKGFSSNQLTVTQKDGKVYVSMQESLLFPSGSAAVNAEGRKALAKLAEVLNLNPDININIEGHTDSIPIKRKFEDNWALSVARSTAIVRILTQDYGVSPLRIIASGRSEYLPVASNETEEGRALNRRTEIILEPKLDALMELLHAD